MPSKRTVIFGLLWTHAEGTQAYSIDHRAQYQNEEYREIREIQFDFLPTRVPKYAALQDFDLVNMQDGVWRRAVTQSDELWNRYVQLFSYLESYFLGEKAIKLLSMWVNQASASWAIQFGFLK